MPCTTKIILDIYGGGGGDDTSGHGCGGRVYAYTSLQENYILHIFVGGKGVSASTGSGGGYNGGGNAGNKGSSGGGGGATDVRTSNGTIKDRILVAGGGGGAGNGVPIPGSGGANDSGDSKILWQGQTPPDGQDGGGGGGGYYGGSYGIDHKNTSRGGSNYADSKFTVLYTGTSTNSANGSCFIRW